MMQQNSGSFGLSSGQYTWLYVTIYQRMNEGFQDKIISICQSLTAMYQKDWTSGIYLGNNLTYLIQFWCEFTNTKDPYFKAWKTKVFISLLIDWVANPYFLLLI